MLTSIVLAGSGSGMPLKYISSCEIDLNADNATDIAFLVETLKGRELIVLMKSVEGYDTFLVTTGKANMHLSCRFGDSIKETLAAGGTGKEYKTPGTYIQLIQPETSSVVYFWDNNKFREVWTSD